MVQVGMLITDVPRSVPPAQQFNDLLRIIEAGQDAGMTYFAIGQHFLYGDLRWLQPVPLLARLSAHVEPHVRLATQILIGPLYHPVMLAEEIATLDIVTEGRAIFGVGLGYRPDEYEYFGVPFSERGKRLDETLEIVKRLWTEDEVTHHGRFWQLEGVKPHIQGVTQPHPTIWVGGLATAGARRAGKYADGFACPPDPPPHEIAKRYLAVQEEFYKRGKVFTPQPLRRNTLIAETEEKAMEEYARLAQGRYIAYAERDLESFNRDALTREFLNTVADHAIIGTSESVTERLVSLATTLPVDPILLRPQWPTMGAEETIAAIDVMGKELIPTLRAVEPRTSIDPSLLSSV